VVLSSSAPERILAIAAASGVPCAEIGRVRRDADALGIKLPVGSMRISLNRMRRAYHDTIPTIMSRTPEHATFDELAPVAAH
jgi:hypothetical protein